MVWKNKRTKKNLPLRKMVLIYTEGYTELIYIEMLNRKYGAGNIRIHAKKGQGSAAKLVEYAIASFKHLDKGFEYQTYVMFDKDEVSWIDIDQSISLARKHDVQVIFSNDSFELFLLLHFKDVSSAQTREQLYRQLTPLIGDYKKLKRDKRIQAKLQDLVGRAYQRGLIFGDLENRKKNPYTNFSFAMEEIYQRKNF